MTDEIYGLKERQWAYGRAYGQRVGLNTAFLLLDHLREKPEAIDELLAYCKQLIASADDEYDFFKTEAKEYMKEHFGEEEEDAEQQAEGQEV